MHPQAIPPGVDEAGTPQVGQVPRDLRLRYPETLVDVADAHLAGQEQAQDAQPRRVTQRLKQPFDLDDPLVHIFVLTNIPWRPRVIHTLTRMHVRAGAY